MAWRRGACASPCCHCCFSCSIATTLHWLHRRVCVCKHFSDVQYHVCVCVLVYFAHSLICFSFFYCFTLVRRLLLILLLSVWRKRNWIKNASKSVIAATALLRFNTTLPDSLFLPLYLSAASALCDAQARSFFALFLAWRVLCARILVSYSYYLYSCKTCKCCYFFMLLQYLLCLVVFGGIKCGNRLAII